MMNPDLPYTLTDADSIETYAKTLEGKSLKDVLGNEIVQTYSGKGKLGQILEDLFFKYKPNSNAEPDFKEAGVELKTTPIKEIKGNFFSKERLVFNIINFNEEHKEIFRTSSFWKKNQHLLLMFYLHDKDKIDLEYIFKIIRLWEFPANDLKIIKDDWERIVAKIKSGKAHEISEGDSLYLGACTKGANNKSLRSQPFCDKMAMQRAFSLKSKYLNFIIEKSLKGEEIFVNKNDYPIILEIENKVEEPFVSYKRTKTEELEPIIKSIDEYSKGETFEQYVVKKFQPYIGLTENEIVISLQIKSSDAKSRYYDIAKAILGVTKRKIEEFEKAEVMMKTIRLEHSGALKESMSFPQIKYKEIINEDFWEDSYWHYALTRRFFLVVFQKDTQGNPVLQKVMFWTMPVQDLAVAEEFWQDTKQKILNDDYERFWKISDDKICHVRPKGINSQDMMETPSGRVERKKCYWLNSAYIKKVIE
ncbi:MAG: MutH/Sau3AI family endonuclease [Elusimicrobiota bacterium]